MIACPAYAGELHMIDFVELASLGCDCGQSCGFHVYIFIFALILMTIPQSANYAAACFQS
jgi:hypothetical protein